MKTLKKASYILLVALTSTAISCSPEDGATGPQGPAGMDGNANVRNITFDASNFAGTFTDVFIPELTQDVLENDALLTYLNDGTLWFPVPCPAEAYGFDLAVDVNYDIGLVSFDYSDATGTSVDIFAGELQSGRLIIIESSSSTTRGNQFDIAKELRDKGVDINNYYEVCDYFNLEY